MHRFIVSGLLCALALGLSACNIQQNVDDVDAEIGTFHADLAAGHFDLIYDESSQSLKSATDRKQFVALLEAVSRKLGKVKSVKQTGWNVNATTGGTFVTVTMQTEFEKGKGTEQFVYLKDDGVLRLSGYSINSQDMMIN